MRGIWLNWSFTEAAFYLLVALALGWPNLTQFYYFILEKGNWGNEAIDSIL